MRTLPFRFSLPTIALLIVLPFAAGAEPGQLEINRTCALQSGCFPGDAPGFPVTITVSGAYRLTSNLAQTAIPGFSTPANAIEIASDAVRVDLGGFTISCTNPITGTCFGSAVGVTTSGGPRSGAEVSNGDIVGMPAGGVALAESDDSVVRNVRALRNLGNGISVGRGGRVEDSTSAENSGSGILTTTDAQVRNCAARDNGFVGVSLGQGSMIAGSVTNQNSANGIGGATYVTVLGNTSFNNGGSGINVQSGSTVANNMVADNLSNGISAGSGSNVHGNTASFNNGFGITSLGAGYRGNVAVGNSVGAYSGGTDLGGNL